jgi:aminoglycoside 3-N-acetyltransferase
VRRYLRSALPPRLRTHLAAAVGGLSPRLSFRWLRVTRGPYVRLKKAIVGRYLCFGPVDLLARLRGLGIQTGDTVCLHSSFQAQSGFRGTPSELVEVFLQAIGPAGNLLMVSLPYLSTTRDYLARNVLFDVRRTPSMMGLVSEVFRRRPGVLRSLHPTHPVLAAGPKSGWIVEGHEGSLLPCGPDTPFGKFAALGGKAVFLDARFSESFTFFHYLEDMVNFSQDFPLYADEPVEIPVVDHLGVRRSVRTYVFSQQAIQRRWPELLEVELRRRGAIRETRIGCTRLQVVSAQDAIRCVEDMAMKGRYFYGRG